VFGSIVLHAPCWLHNIVANGGDFLSSVESTIIAVKIPIKGFPKNADNTDTDNEISGDSVGQLGSGVWLIVNFCQCPQSLLRSMMPGFVWVLGLVLKEAVCRRTKISF